MEANYNFGILGGDMRQVYLARILAEKGYQVVALGLQEKAGRGSFDEVEKLEEFLKEADVIIGPVPISRDGETIWMNNQSNISLADVIDTMKEGQSFFAGCISEDIKNRAEKNKVQIYDFMENEALAIKNSIATAEGAIAEAITKSKVNIRGSNCVVLGYGKCGQTIADYLQGMCARVTVCARSNQARAQAFACGFYSEDIGQLKKYLKDAQFLFNTIPKQILGARELQSLSDETVIIDIASSPGGVDYEMAKKFHIKACLCPGLPGKYAPLTSARAIAETVIRQINKRE